MKTEKPHWLALGWLEDAEKIQLRLNYRRWDWKVAVMGNFSVIYRYTNPDKEFSYSESLLEAHERLSKLQRGLRFIPFNLMNKDYDAEQLTEILRKKERKLTKALRNYGNKVYFRFFIYKDLPDFESDIPIGEPTSGKTYLTAKWRMQKAKGDMQYELKNKMDSLMKDLPWESFILNEKEEFKIYQNKGIYFHYYLVKNEKITTLRRLIEEFIKDKPIQYDGPNVPLPFVKLNI